MNPPREQGNGYRPPPLDFDALRFRSRSERSHKVEVSAAAGLPDPGAAFGAWFDALPQFLAASALRAVVDAVVRARRDGRPVVFAFGGHVVKTGCSPIVVDLIRRGIVTAVATNGSGAIHDVELAETGCTSEEVADTIRDGSFGMVRETCERLNAAAQCGAAGGGLGRALGELLLGGAPAHLDMSIFAAAARAGIPATVHVAVGTDTVHMHPQADGAALGAATLADFRLLCAVVADFAPAGAGQAAGVWLNVGSAVIMPEVFLKAVSVARNLGRNLDDMHTASLDMLRHYRPAQNVIGRPVKPGHGHLLTGPHELILPLLRQALIERCGAG